MRRHGHRPGLAGLPELDGLVSRARSSSSAGGGEGLGICLWQAFGQLDRLARLRSQVEGPRPSAVEGAPALPWVDDSSAGAGAVDDSLAALGRLLGIVIWRSVSALFLCLPSVGSTKSGPAWVSKSQSCHGFAARPGRSTLQGRVAGQLVRSRWDWPSWRKNPPGLAPSRWLIRGKGVGEAGRDFSFIRLGWKRIIKEKGAARIRVPIIAADARAGRAVSRPVTSWRKPVSAQPTR